MDKICARILLLGKTGVGKSSFINYFIGQDVAKIGIGKPVTQELEEYELEYKGTYLSITDSKGLEVENSEQIKKDIINNVIKRNRNSNIFEWYHTIFYCISIVNARIEKYEIELLKELKNKVSQNIHIILTNCDSSEQNNEQVEAMNKKLKDELGEEIEIYKVCSVEIIKRNGKKILPHGKDQIVSGVFKLLWKDICFKVAEDFTKNEVKPRLKKFLNEKKETIDEILDKKISIWSLIIEKINKNTGERSELEDELNNYFEEEITPGLIDLVGILENQLRKKIKEIQKFYSNYYSIITKDEIIEEVLTDIPEKLQNLISYLKKEFDKELKGTSGWKQILLPLYNIVKPKQIRKSLSDTLNNYYDELYIQIENYKLEEEIYNKMYSMLKIN